jgi:hypothetical protein
MKESKSRREELITVLFELIPVSSDLHVEGVSDAPGVGEFRGPVLAIGLRGSDPVAAAATAEGEREAEQEGFLGWGTTYFLVADPGKPAPVWVAKHDITAQRLGGFERRTPVEPEPGRV